MLIHIYMMNTINTSIGQKIRLENRIPIGTSIAQVSIPPQSRGL
jgi:hypothetical protein